MRLQICHQESGGGSLSGYISDDQAETIAAEFEKVVVVASDHARRKAKTRVFECAELWLSLREKSGLNLPGILRFQNGTALGFKFFEVRAADLLDFAIHRVVAHEREGVAVQILKPCRGPAPGFELRQLVKADSVFLPFLVLAEDVFREKFNLSGPANELVILGIGPGRDQSKIGGSIGRSDN